MNDPTALLEFSPEAVAIEASTEDDPHEKLEELIKFADRLKRSANLLLDTISRVEERSVRQQNVEEKETPKDSIPALRPEDISSTSHWGSHSMLNSTSSHNKSVSKEVIPPAVARMPRRKKKSLFRDVSSSSSSSSSDDDDDVVGIRIPTSNQQNMTGLTEDMSYQTFNRTSKTVPRFGVEPFDDDDDNYNVGSKPTRMNRKAGLKDDRSYNTCPRRSTQETQTQPQSSIQSSEVRAKCQNPREKRMEKNTGNSVKNIEKQWICDVCRDVSFTDFGEACCHEEGQCEKTRKGSQSPPTTTQTRNTITPPTAVISSTNSDERRWICDICKVISFSDFNEACRHEEQCQISRNGCLSPPATTQTRRALWGQSEERIIPMKAVESDMPNDNTTSGEVSLHQHQRSRMHIARPPFFENDGILRNRKPRVLSPGYKGNLKDSCYLRSVGLTRHVLNENLDELGLSACFGQAVVSRRGDSVSQITLNQAWNDLPHTLNETLEWWLGEGKRRFALTEPMDPIRHPNHHDIPIFWAAKGSKHGGGGTPCHYVGHFRCIQRARLQTPILFKKKFREALIEFQFVNFDDDLAVKMAMIENRSAPSNL